MYHSTHNLAEPSGAIALAALMAERDAQQGKRIGVVQTGGNIDAPMLVEILGGKTPTI